MPQVSIADEGHTYGVAIPKALLNARNVGNIEVGAALVVGVVRMYLEHPLVAGNKGKGKQA